MIEDSRADGVYILCCGGRRIPFRIEFRKRKRLAISVTPDMRLEVVAPEGNASEKILDRVDRRARWILRNWRYFEQFQPQYRGARYVSGETHIYLGRQYRLKLHFGLVEVVKLIGKFLHVWVIDPDDKARVRKLLEYWYREHAQRNFEQRLQICMELCRSLRLVRQPRLTIRKMTRRWGSCTNVGNVLLNINLAKAPVHCIDYVIVHELCHMQAHNHGPQFYRLLSRCMPDWAKRKDRLNSIVDHLPAW
jgi:predicted metal-dependent hydrolase